MLGFLLVAEILEFLLVIDAKSLSPGAVLASDGVGGAIGIATFSFFVKFREYLLVVDADSMFTGIDIAEGGECGTKNLADFLLLVTDLKVLVVDSKSFCKL